ncbi:hypothetical protein GGX14DRAFT_391759 [Mycena pura]|uniref:Uncharacterized protein n=1 Tax=Mycena pura TaxID=153505 RepID=A0AAD6VQ34_9AGAR|nr:hypothetical protein GGX14DRAFT_391759 [Mycena pura]
MYDFAYFAKLREPPPGFGGHLLWFIACMPQALPTMLARSALALAPDPPMAPVPRATRRPTASTGFGRALATGSVPLAINSTPRPRPALADEPSARAAGHARAYTQHNARARCLPPLQEVALAFGAAFVATLRSRSHGAHFAPPLPQGAAVELGRAGVGRGSGVGAVRRGDVGGAGAGEAREGRGVGSRGTGSA